jgi:hypothetical protein
MAGATWVLRRAELRRGCTFQQRIITHLSSRHKPEHRRREPHVHVDMPPAAYMGRGSCYVEYGAGRVARVDVDFFSGPAPTGSFMDPSVALADEKKVFGSSRRSRWFGL